MWTTILAVHAGIVLLLTALFLALGPAILNVVLHAVVFVLVGRRGASRQASHA